MIFFFFKWTKKKNIPEEWLGALCFSLKWLIWTGATAKYSAAQSVPEPGVWQLTVRQWQLCLCVSNVYVITCSGLNRNHSCVTNFTVDSTRSSSGDERLRTTARRAHRSAFCTNHSMCWAVWDHNSHSSCDIGIALTTLSTCPSLCPPLSQSERTFWARSIMSVTTWRRTSCDSALRRICRHTGRFSTSDGGKRVTSSIWQQRWFRENTPFC